MREFTSAYLRLFQKEGQLVCLVFACLAVTGLLWAVPGQAAAGQAVVKKMIIQADPLSVRFSMTGKAPLKVIQIGDKELLVAMKNVVLARDFAIQGRKSVASVSVEALEGNVLAVVITGKSPYGPITSKFDPSGLKVSLGRKTGKKTSPVTRRAAPVQQVAPPAAALVSGAKGPAGPQQTAEQPAAPSAVAPDRGREPVTPKKRTPLPEEKKTVKKTDQRAEAPVYVAPRREKSKFKGDISDIYRGIDPRECEAKPVENAVLLIKKERWQEAFKVLDQYLAQGNVACIELADYLKAFCFYKSVGENDYAGLIKAERMFQDSLVAYPKSFYVPFAYTAIGMIQKALKNPSAAEGYFDIVRQDFGDYTGMPEVQYHLAEIYDEKGYTDKALRLYQTVFQSPLENSYIADAGVGYGKALFKKRRYYDALGIFNHVIETDVKKVYASPDLLMYTANANFELGLSRPARQQFMRVLNLFPDIPDRDMVLSRVGDAFGMENNEAKALKIYALVREKYPDTQGFINASIGLARYMKTDEEKIEIYQMIKTRFPENTYARIAMMRLAEIYQKNKEYNKCIQEIEDLLSTHPRGLRYEAVKLMQRAYEALFKEQLKDDEYTSILNRYELEHVKLDKMGSREIALGVGMAYLRAGLFEEAFNHLMVAYKRYKRAERSAGLLYGLGMAMDESGRNADALKLFTAFSKRFPKHRNRVDALKRIGRIHLENKRFERAHAILKTAYAVSKNSRQKGDVLMLHAQVYGKKGDLKTAAGYRKRAVKDFASAPGKNYDILASAYKALGNTYLDLKSYVQAADAYAKALSFSQGDRAKANIGFLLGDAYQKGNVTDKAIEAFEQVAGSYDSVWARLARQRLSTLDLAEKMINS